MIILYNFGSGILAIDYSAGNKKLAEEYIETCYGQSAGTIFLNEQESHIYCKLEKSDEDHPIYLKMRSNSVYDSLISFAAARGIPELLI